MLESDWMICDEVTPMLNMLRSMDVWTERQIRLFAVACCRHLSQQVPIGINDLHAIEVAERYADGKATIDELIAARYAPDAPSISRTASIACRNTTETEDIIIMADCAAGNAAWAMGEHAMSVIKSSDDRVVFDTAVVAEQQIQASFLRDIVGPLPSRANHFVSTCRDSLAVKKIVDLAQRLYELTTITFEQMNLLADTLQREGCDSAEVLDHCRDRARVHVRGCWVIDLILSKCV